MHSAYTVGKDLEALHHVTDLPLCANSERPAIEPGAIGYMPLSVSIGCHGTVSLAVILMVTMGSYRALVHFLNNL